MINDYVKLSLRNLRKRGVRSWLTMLGIFVGIAAVVSLISLGQGLEEAITGQFGSLDPDKLVVQSASAGFGPPGSFAAKKLTKHDLELLEEIPGVHDALSRLVRVISVEYNEVTKFKTVGSLPEDDDELQIVYDALNFEPEVGDLLKSGDQKKVILGNGFSNGEFGREIKVGKKIILQGEKFEVVGIMEKEGNFILDNAVFMLEDDLKEILEIGDEIDLIVVEVDDPDEIEIVSKEIEKRMRKDRKLKPGEEDFSVQTPIQSLQTIGVILNIINLIVGGIAAISLLVGGIGIANTMYTSVLERTKEIGVMKAIGARNRDIASIFVIESGLLGLAGGIIGVFFGFIVSKTLEYIAINQIGTTLLRAATPTYLFVGCLAFAFLSGAVSGAWPSWRASKIRPADALRYE